MASVLSSELGVVTVGRDRYFWGLASAKRRIQLQTEKVSHYRV